MKAGAKVVVQNYKNNTCEKGEVVRKFNSSRSYLVKMENSRILRKNVVHIIRKGITLLYEGNVGVTKNFSRISIKEPVITKCRRVIKHPSRLGINSSYKNK